MCVLHKLSRIKKIPIGVVIALIALTAAVSISVSYLTAIRQTNAKLQDINERQAMFSKLGEIDTLVRGAFYGQIDETALSDALAYGYAAGLNDENVLYLNSEDCKDYRSYAENTTEPVCGIGVEVVQDAGTFRIVRVYENSAAQAAGLQVGDEIVEIDGQKAGNIAYLIALSRLNQSEGMEVNLTVARGNVEDATQEAQNLSVSVTCSKLDIGTVTGTLLDNQVGYLSVMRMRAETGKETESWINTLREQGATGWVIDLRGCGGTDEKAVADVADLLLGEADTVRAQNAAGNVETLYRSSGEKAAEGKVVCLVDSFTTGTAEVLAAALQDAGCTIVGQTTAGNAVRTTFSRLSDGSGLILPVGYYVRADDTQINGTGVVPDAAVALDESQAVLYRYGKLEVKQDAQVQAASQAAAA